MFFVLINMGCPHHLGELTCSCVSCVLSYHSRFRVDGTIPKLGSYYSFRRSCDSAVQSHAHMLTWGTSGIGETKTEAQTGCLHSQMIVCFRPATNVKMMSL